MCFIISFIFLLFLTNISADEDILCSTTICQDVTCSSLPTNCNIQNLTHRGLFLPSPQTCNCCEFCIAYLDEGASCTTGSLDSRTPESMCGPGLYCNSASRCARMTEEQSECIHKQDEYAANLPLGNVGTMQLPPNCDENGYFDTYNCIPGESCYCVHKNGSRLFGQIDYTGIPDIVFKCGCSRMHAEAEEIIGRHLQPGEYFRCTSNGDFDPIQCIDDMCFCVDPFDGTPIDPNANSVNITFISKENISCFDEDLHQQNQYYKHCELMYQQALDDLDDFHDDGYSMVLSYALPKCDIDGTYQALQENTTHKYCVSPEGQVLLSLSKLDSENYSLLEVMDCKCIRARSVISSLEKPECDINGNYNKKQCRRGVCRCVDNNGNQVCENMPCESVISNSTFVCN